MKTLIYFIRKDYMKEKELMMPWRLTRNEGRKGVADWYRRNQAQAEQEKGNKFIHKVGQQSLN